MPGVRFAVAAFSEKHAALVREQLAGTGLAAEVHVGRTPEIIAAADASIAVSGSVGLELLGRLTPTVVVYRVGRTLEWVGRRLATCKYMSLVNLLADAELLPPEFPTSDWIPDKIARPVIEWLTRPELRAARVDELRTLRDKVAVPGATAAPPTSSPPKSLGGRRNVVSSDRMGVAIAPAGVGVMSEQPTQAVQDYLKAISRSAGRTGSCHPPTSPATSPSKPRPSRGCWKSPRGSGVDRVRTGRGQ